MATHDPLTDRDAVLVAAAQAAASWARARRAAWTDAPLPVAEPPPPISTRSDAVSLLERPPEGARPPEPETPEPLRPLEPVRLPEPPRQLEPAPRTVAAAPPSTPAIPPSVSEPAVARVASAVRRHAPAVARRLAWITALVLLAAGAVAGVRYALRTVPPLLTREATVERTASTPPVSTLKTTGDLHVVSTPPGARVTVDAEPRGVTPLTLADLSPGRHEVVVESDAGTVRRTVTIAANETEEVDVSIFSGWLIVYAPFDIEVAEGARVLQPDERNLIMLPPGTHELRLANRTLDYEATRRVEVRPGETTTVRLTPPASTLAVAGAEGAEVWLDGARIGQTPLGAVPVSLGTHEVVVRRGGAERRFTVTVGAKPFTLNADFGG